MLFEDSTPHSQSFAKDPCVIQFHGEYYMYYSKPEYLNDTEFVFTLGIARSQDMEHWAKLGAIKAEQAAEGRGICAPGGIVLNGVIHLFYQSYGQFPRDYICHATSTDGVHFTHDASNPIIQPTGAWNIGRAIDADVVAHNCELFLYWATRDPGG